MWPSSELHCHYTSCEDYRIAGKFGKEKIWRITQNDEFGWIIIGDLTHARSLDWRLKQLLGMGDFVLESVVRIYKAIWAGTSGEILSCSTEPGNSSDAYAVGVKKMTTLLGTCLGNFQPYLLCFLTNLVLYYVSLMVAVSTVLISISFPSSP